MKVMALLALLLTAGWLMNQAHDASSSGSYSPALASATP